MEERVFVSILRRRTRQVLVGPVGIGGDARISVQSMTKPIPGMWKQLFLR